MQSFKNYLSLDPLADTVEKINSLQNNNAQINSSTCSTMQSTTECYKLIKPAATITQATRNQNKNNNRAQLLLASTVPCSGLFDSNIKRFSRCFQTPQFNLNSKTNLSNSSSSKLTQQQDDEFRALANNNEKLITGETEPRVSRRINSTTKDKYKSLTLNYHNGSTLALTAASVACNKANKFTKIVFLKRRAITKQQPGLEAEVNLIARHKQIASKLKEFKPAIKRVRKLKLVALAGVEGSIGSHNSTKNGRAGGTKLKGGEQEQIELKQYEALTNSRANINNHKLKLDSKICVLDQDNEINILQRFYSKPEFESEYKEKNAGNNRVSSNKRRSSSSGEEELLPPNIQTQAAPASREDTKSIILTDNPNYPKKNYNNPAQKKKKKGKQKYIDLELRAKANSKGSGGGIGCCEAYEGLNDAAIDEEENDHDDASSLLKSTKDGPNLNTNISNKSNINNDNNISKKLNQNNHRNFDAIEKQQNENFNNNKNNNNKGLFQNGENSNSTATETKSNILIIKPILKGKSHIYNNNNNHNLERSWDTNKKVDLQHNITTKIQTSASNKGEAFLIEEEEKKEAFSLLDPQSFILRAKHINNNLRQPNCNNYCNKSNCWDNKRCVNFETTTNCPKIIPSCSEEKEEELENRADLLVKKDLFELTTTAIKSESQITDSKSMKRSKMSMNLAGLGPAQELQQQRNETAQKSMSNAQIDEQFQLKDYQYLPDTISASNNQSQTTKTSSKTTTRKTTQKLIPAHRNISESEQITSSGAYPPQLTNTNTNNTSSVFINNNSNSHNPGAVTVNPTNHTITSTTTVDGKIITTEKSSNYNRTYEKKQRIIDQPLPNQSKPLEPLPKLQSILRKPDNLRYIDDDDDYQCHDNTSSKDVPKYDRIVPQPRPSSANSFRSGLRESINQLDRLIDSEQQKLKSSPKIEPVVQVRSISAQNRKSEPEQFHPTWDEWKREQNSVNSAAVSSLGLKLDITARSKKSVNNTNETSEKTTSTKHSVIEETYRQNSNSNKQEYQVSDTVNNKSKQTSDQIELKLNNSDKHQPQYEKEQRATIVINNTDTANMKNQVRLNIGGNGNASAGPQRFDSRKFHKQNSVDLYESTYSSSSKRDLRKQSLTKRLEEIFTENNIPITPITQSNLNIKQILSKPKKEELHVKQSVSPTKVLNTPRHPVYPIDRQMVRATSPVQYSSATLAKDEPLEMPVVQRAETPAQPQLPQPKKIQKTILSTKRRDSAPNFTGWRDDESMPALVRQQSGAIPIEYISIRLDPKPQEVKEPAKRSITTGTNTNVERGKKIASTNTNQDELPQYNLHVSLDSLFVKQRREASTETEARNQVAAATETETRHKDACTVTDDEAEPPLVDEQYLYRSHNSRYAAWETQSNPPQEDYRLEFLAKSPRTIHRKHTCSHTHHCCSSEDIYGFNQICNQGMALEK